MSIINPFGQKPFKCSCFENPNKTTFFNIFTDWSFFEEPKSWKVFFQINLSKTHRLNLLFFCEICSVFDRLLSLFTAVAEHGSALSSKFPWLRPTGVRGRLIGFLIWHIIVLSNLNRVCEFAESVPSYQCP